jgi:hypothetical protein
MIKRLALSALLCSGLVGLSGAASAQTTVLGPSITSVTAGVAATLAALPANPARKALTICNEIATVSNVFFTTGTTVPSATVGQVLVFGNVAASCFTMGQPGVTGSGGIGAQINVIASAGTPVVTFIEYF